MVQGEDLLGDGVNVAARLQSAAEPGGICIAGSVYDQIRNKLSLSFKPLGEVSYKNIPQAVRTFAIAEAEGLGVLPAPASGENRRERGLVVWPAMVAVLLLIAAGVGLWAYFDNQHIKAEFARQAQLTVERAAAQAAKQEARLAAEKLATDQQQQRADAEPQAAQVATPDRLRTALAIPDPPHPAPPVLRPAEATDPSGLYRGQICYGPGESNPAHCYEAQAIVLHNRISGEWPGRLPGTTIYLSGRISSTGDVEIHMHSKRANASRFAVIDMIGTLRDGRIDAAGDFLNGRHATLNWRKN